MAHRSSTPEDDLVQKFQDGDGEALCALFERYEAMLRARIDRWLPRHVQRRVSVSDVLQETRMVALRRHGDFELRGPRAFRNWVLGIAELRARRVAQKHEDVAKRAAGREVTQAHRGATAQVAGAHPSPSQIAVANELGRMAHEALGDLSADHREVLRLVRNEQLTLREAAKQMERSREATKKLYGRALAEFGKCLRRRWGESLG